MSGKSKYNKRSKNKTPSKAARIFAVVSISVVVLVAVIWSITAVVTTVKKKKADRTVRIAFYGISENLYPVLQEIIPKEEKIDLKMDILSEGSLDLGALKQKYDMLFTWKGEVTDALADSSENIPDEILSILPNSLKNKKCAPILLDHFELAYSKDIVQKTTQSIPSTFASFINYLEQARSYAFSPFFCLGADDRIMTALVGALVQSRGGLNAYNNLIQAMREDTDFETLLDLNLNDAGATPACTLRSVLDLLKEWPKEGLTHPAWFNGNGNDLLYFAQEKHIAVFFTTLTEHRKIPYDVISQYEEYPMPVMSTTSSYGLIAPAISCMLLSDNENAKRYLEAFFTEDTQASLSDKTMLAPVHLRAQAYDRQADDVRFYSASCAGGALPDLYLAVFQRNPAKMTEFANNCRTYVR